MYARRFSFAGIVAAVTLSACAATQNPPASPVTAGKPSSAATQPSAVAAAFPRSENAAMNGAPDLTLGTGDLIEVSVFDVPELSNLKARIPSSGAITLPLLGPVSAAGLTPGELQSAIRLRLQDKYMHDPQVSVFVTEHKSQRIFVSGAVKAPGAYEIIRRVRVTDAISMAGGVTDEAGRTVQVSRRQGEGATAPITQTAIALDTLANASDEANVELQAGDVVDVARAGTYYVGGEVSRAGSFPLKVRTTVAQATVNAGGPKDVADWDDVRLYRRRPDGSTEIQTFSLNEFENGKPSPELQADDIVIVGKSPMKAFLYGVRDFLRFGVGASLPL